MGTTKWRARNKHDLVIEVWEQLDCESVGAHELEQIQHAVRERFGEGAVASPASIARVLADEGAHLRHPEVLDFDTEWRKRASYESLFRDTENFSDLEQAASSIRKLEDLRCNFSQNGDSRGRDHVSLVAVRAKQQASLLANSEWLDEKTRAESKEIEQWLTIWLQSPLLFADWLTMRRLSTEFRQRFVTPES